MASIKKKNKNPLAYWNINDSRELYSIDNWGNGFFDINEKGNVVVEARHKRNNKIDLKELIEDLVERGIELPILLRFTDILKMTVDKINDCFDNAIREYGYKGEYRGVYPIKVNQQNQIVDEIIEFGRKHNSGLEAGSKAELLIAVSYLKDNETILVCNGYKDSDYIETALRFTKLGKKIFLVVEKLSELKQIIKISKKLKIKPNIGIRMKLSTVSKGNWESSSGDKSKFGLFVGELTEAIEILRKNNMIQRFRLLHTHIGSQITSIQRIKAAYNEFARIYVELRKMKIPVEYYDVGGGLGVDYDGSKTNYPSSMNYTWQEYANDVVYSVANICKNSKIPQPTIITESGRSLVAYSSVLVFNILGSSSPYHDEITTEYKDSEHIILKEMIKIYKDISVKNFRECYHDAIQCKDESLTLFNVGYLSLSERAEIEKLFWAICHKISLIISKFETVPEEFENLKKLMAHIYFGNFSIFQSAPDHWAIKQLFPVMPIHRHSEKPVNNAVICDITCDSDGKIDQFIDAKEVLDFIKVHKLKEEEPYYMGMFLIGAYQETLGDLHNLFGDTNTVHVSIKDNNTYNIEKIIEGDLVEDVISYVQYSKKELMSKIRAIVENSVREGGITLKESRETIKNYEKFLKSYTYLS